MAWHTATLFLLSWCSLSAVQATNYRLPDSIVPIHYDLRLLIDVDPASNFSYYGIVKILVKAVQETDKIVLHAQRFNLSEDNIKVTGADDSYEVSNTSTDNDLNFLSLQLDRSLKKDENYTVTVPYFGNLGQDLDGIYVSHYANKTRGEKEWLATTQFEPIYARKAFPCFDEPLLKATFKVTIGHNKGYTAVSNMPLERTTEADTAEDNWLWDEMSRSTKKDKSEMVWDHFETSVPMSTYLLAFVVSKFSYLESPRSLSKTLFRIWTRSDAMNQAVYASTVGPSVLSFYEKFFDVPFPLPKQDMFAIPDFSAGAMENWGLITYRETALLYDNKESSFTAKERVASVIAHELAHQWFGNLVTMKWWSDLWLNEGFATYVGSVGVDAIEPAWNHHNSEAVSNMRTVFTMDALTSSHPVSAEIENPKRIFEIFDAISYKKGANIIRMMNMFLGQDIFRAGIKNYLMKYSYRSAEQDDLWQCLTEAAVNSNVLTRKVTVKQIMDTWTKQTGYPLITVNRDYTDSSLTVSQKRYLSLGAESNNNASESWWIPLNVLCESEVGEDKKIPIEWLSDQEGITNVHKYQHASTRDQWVLFNRDMIALYRVNYDHRNWELLIDTLNSDNYKSIPELSRVQLLADVFELAWTNVLDYTTALKLGNYLHRETDLLPLETGLGALYKIENVLARTIDFGAFQKFMRKLITKTYQNAGGLYTKKIVNPDDLTRVQMQVMMSRWACRMKVPNCEQNAIDMFKEWMQVSNPDEENPIPVDLRSTVYCVAVSRGSVEQWAFLFQRYQNANVAAAKTTMMQALTCTNEIWILKQYLEWTVDNGPEVRKQDAASVITGIAKSSVGFYIAKPFLYTRIADIDKAFFGQSRRLVAIVKVIVSQFTSQDELDEFLLWRAKNEKYLAGAKLTVEQAIESARINIEWLKQNQETVVKKLREYAMRNPPPLKRKLVPRKIKNSASEHAATVYVYIRFICIVYSLINVT